MEGRTEGEDGVMVQQILIGQKVDTDVGVICLREKDIFANLFVFSWWWSLIKSRKIVFKVKKGKGRVSDLSKFWAHV